MKRWRPYPWLAVLMLALPGAAWAQQSYGASELAKGRILFTTADVRNATSPKVTFDRPLGGTVDATDCEFEFTANGGAIKRVDGKPCGGLWRVESPVDLIVSLTLGGITKPYTVEGIQADLQRRADQQDILLSGNTIAAGSELQNQKLVLRLPRKDGGSAWVEKDADAQGNISLAPGEQSLLADRGNLMLFTTDAAGQARYWEVRRNARKQSPPPGAPLGQQDVLRGGPLSRASGYLCNDANRAQSNLQLICADAVLERIIITRTPSQHVARPNRGFLVAVRHLERHAVRVSIDAEPGLYDTPLRDQIDEKPGLTAGGAPEPTTVTTHTFAPRRPGSVNILITLVDRDNTLVDRDNESNVLSERRVELIVEQTYSGALRLGIASVFGAAVDRGYEARARPGSGQLEIAQTLASPVDLELVLGLAPFIEQAWGGRGYATDRRLSEAPFGLAPYIGIGILNEKRNALELLKSLHAGIEWEINPNFSLALTYVVRRVDRLPPGITVGAPVSEEAVATVEKYQSGWGLVLNFSPEFLRFARREGSSFF